MKIYLPFIICIIAFLSCNSPANTDTRPAEQKAEPPKKQSFFPVTSYIKGQLFEIRQKSVNPLKYTTVKGHTDSAWLKLEAFDEAIKEFLSPAIDSTNMVSMFTETNFLDQSVDAYTFTYEPSKKLPDSMQLRHWDVYIDPASGKVRRIYMVKNIGPDKELRLTWQGDKWCSIIYVATDQNGNSVVEKEEKITWDF